MVGSILDADAGGLLLLVVVVFSSSFLSGYVLRV
jgi:hypothetical protein